MSSRIRAHIRSNVVGYVAVFIALSGTAYADDGPLAGTNTVGSQDIIEGEVYSSDVRDDTLANGGLRGVDIANNSLTSFDVTGLNGGDVTNQSLTGTDVADQSINSDDVFGLGSADITDNTLTGADVAGSSLFGSDVAGNTLGSEDVRQEGLRGEDIDEGTLDLNLQQYSYEMDASSAGKSLLLGCPDEGQFVLDVGWRVIGEENNVLIEHAMTHTPGTEGGGASLVAREIHATPNAWTIRGFALCARIAG